MSMKLVANWLQCTAAYYTVTCFACDILSVDWLKNVHHYVASFKHFLCCLTILLSALLFKKNGGHGFPRFSAFLLLQTNKSQLVDLDLLWKWVSILLSLFFLQFLPLMHGLLIPPFSARHFEILVVFSCWHQLASSLFLFWEYFSIWCVFCPRNA